MICFTADFMPCHEIHLLKQSKARSLSCWMLGCPRKLSYLLEALKPLWRAIVLQSHMTFNGQITAHPPPDWFCTSLSLSPFFCPSELNSGTSAWARALSLCWSSALYPFDEALAGSSLLVVLVSCTLDRASWSPSMTASSDRASVSRVSLSFSSSCCFFCTECFTSLDRNSHNQHTPPQNWTFEGLKPLLQTAMGFEDQWLICLLAEMTMQDQP